MYPGVGGFYTGEGYTGEDGTYGRSYWLGSSSGVQTGESGMYSLIKSKPESLSGSAIFK